MGNINGKDTVSAEGILLHQTDKAHLIEFLNVGKVWLPTSQYAKECEISDTETGECTVFIPRWLAENNNIKYDEYETENERAYTKYKELKPEDDILF